MDDEYYLSVVDLSDLLKIPVITLYNWVSQGGRNLPLPIDKTKNGLKWRGSDIEKYMALRNFFRKMGMSIKSDGWINQACLDSQLITHFSETSISQKNDNRIISYGTSSYGYDVRCTDEFKIIKPIKNGLIDPKVIDTGNFTTVKGQFCIIPPNSFALTSTIEVIKVPRNMLVVCLGKSTYARCGIIVNVTPLEPEWEGNITIEISNTTPLPVKVYSNEGIAQLIFFEANQECEVSYQDRNGKYQNQRGITLPKV